MFHLVFILEGKNIGEAKKKKFFFHFYSKNFLFGKW